MSDIVESLEHQLDEFDSGKAIHFDYSGLRALIAEIRRLREENATLRAKDEETHFDAETGTTWNRPTAWAYMAVCKANDAKRARLEKARAALSPFAAKAELWLSSVPDCETLWITLGITGTEEKDEQITLGDLRRAAVWMKEDTTDDT